MDKARSARMALFLLVVLSPSVLALPAGMLARPQVAGLLPKPALPPRAAQSPSQTPADESVSSASWVIETVDSPGDVGSWTSLALDADNLPRISYYDSDNADVKYARHDGTTWQIETVDSSGHRHTSLALDAPGRPHISYGSGDLEYAHYDGSAWIIETVDSVGDVGYWSSLAIDSAGRPHISYIDYTNETLKHARYDGTWHIETVDSGLGDWYTGGSTSLALDSDGHPHISYADGVQGDLKYAWYDGSTWQTDVVDSAVDTAIDLHSSLAIDSAGRPHICYHVDYILKYARYDGIGWQIETVDDSSGDVGAYVSLVLDAADHPHVSYIDFTAFVLKYAYHSGTAWASEVVDDAGSVGRYNSLALDTAGLPHISYKDDSRENLKYAYALPTCLPVSGVGIDGAVLLPVEVSGLYTATYTPLTATLPVTLTWDNGTVGPTAIYSWTLLGDYTITVTATNPCGLARAALAVEVVPPPVMRYLPLVVKSGAGCDPVHEAAFTWAPPTPTVGLAVIFSGQAQGELPLHFAWDMGDGSARSGISVTHAYAAAGDYTVTMTATNACGQQVVQHLVQVIDCDPVHGADFTWAPPTPHVGEAVTFSGQAQGELPLHFAWDMGDGSARSGISVTHAYAAAGDYIVTMTATNACGEEVVQHLVPVVLCAPVQILTVTTAISGCVVDFGAQLVGDPPFNYAWDFGPFGSSSQASPQVDFGASGTYPYTLTVSNCGGGDSDTYTGEVAVECATSPVQEAGMDWAPLVPAVGEVVTFTGYFTPANATPPVTFSWDFDDGGSAVGAVVTHTFAEARFYTLTMMATNECGTAWAADIILVVEPPCAPVQIITVTTAISSCVVDFAAQLAGDPPFTYFWDFGPFGTSPQAMPQVDFGASGTYPYTLTVYNCEGLSSDSYAGLVTVQCASCTPVQQAAYTWIPLTPTVGEAVTFIGYFSPPTATPPITFSWDFGDGGFAVGAVVTHSFAAAGTYTVALFAENACGTALVLHGITVVSPAYGPSPSTGHLIAAVPAGPGGGGPTGQCRRSWQGVYDPHRRGQGGMKARALE